MVKEKYISPKITVRRVELILHMLDGSDAEADQDDPTVGGGDEDNARLRGSSFDDAAFSSEW